MRNKRKKIIQICALAALVILMAFFAAPARDVSADAGEFSGNSDYDFSGGGDYDSGGDSFGGDWSSWDNDDSRDYGGVIVDSGGGSAARSSSSGDATDTGELILIFWLILIAALIIYTKRKKDSGRRTVRNRDLGGTDIRQDRSVLHPMREYTALDPSFDEEKFKTLLSNVYVQMQQQWTKKDFESLRPYFTDSLYAQFDRQLDAYRKGNRTNYIDRIAVLSVNLAGFYQTGSGKSTADGRAAAGEDVIIAQIRSRIVDYTLDDATGELLSGSKTAEKFMTYEWTLTRTSGLTSRKEGEFTTVNCPNCGAPVNINESAKCPYCGSVLHLREHDFVISGIKGIAQKTSG